MKSVVIANWKMNPSSWRDAKKLFEATRKAAERAAGVAVVVAPPALYLRELAASYKGRKIAFAAQNAHAEAGGAYTGELSMVQARDAKAGYVLIGHAERRAVGETDADTRVKVAAALTVKLIPVLCIGERTRNTSGEHFTFVGAQLFEGLAEVSTAKLNAVIIAYEPVWAIGADKPMSARDMHEMAIFIRKKIAEKHGPAAMKVKILYGGAIEEHNAAQMLRDGDVDGLLVGRASTDADTFAALLGALSA